MIRLSRLNHLFLLFFIALLMSCEQQSSQDQEREKILGLIASMRNAHFEGDAEKFLDPMFDSFVEVRSGSYMKLFKQESLPGIQTYFDNMEFLELEDVQEPVMEISKDASLASYIGSIIVKGRMENKPIFDKLSFQSIFRKEDDQWKIIHNVNTFLPKARLGTVIMERVKKRFADLSDTVSIVAKAKCSGPTDDFETLVLSASSYGRMEQQSSDGHIILQHGDSGSWMKDMQSLDVRENLDSLLIGFIVGHEHHWLTYRPEDRFEDPEFKRIAEFEGKTAFEIVFEDPLKREIVFYYSFDDYRPLGFKYPSHREGEMISSQFLDWTEINGIPVFKKVIIDENGTQWEYSFTEISLAGKDTSVFENKKTLLSPGANIEAP